MLVKFYCLWIFKLGVYVLFVQPRGFARAQVVLSPSSTAVVLENNSMTFTCTYSGDETATYFTWSVSKGSESTFSNIGIITAECKAIIFAVDTSLYNYTCPNNKRYTWTIKKVTRQNDGDKYRCNVDTLTLGSINSNNVVLSVQVNTCTTNTVQHAKTGGSVTMQFKARTVHPESPQLFVANIIKSPNGSTVLAILYTNGVTATPNPTCNGCSFIGDTSTGNISVRLDNLQATNGGIYKHSLQSSSEDVKCVTVFILGVPDTPTITDSDNNSYEGGSIVLACNSKSTTTPADPNLHFRYKWKVDNVLNPGNPRYTYTQNTLIISHLAKQDAKKSFVCAVTESGSGVIGLSSSWSDAFTFNVIYGPDKCNINIQSPYALAEGNTSTEITCQSDCYPSCSNKWTNSSTGKVVGSEGMFQLDKVTRYEAGNYTCICENTALINSSKATPLQVIVNSASLFIEGHKGQKVVTVDEYDTDIQFNCEIDSYQESRIQILFKDVLLKETHQPTVLTFTRSSIMCSHAGVYTCKGSNQHAQAPSSNINLFVRCSPRPLQQIKQNKTSSLYVPTSLTFTTIAYPEPGPTGFFWHKENGVIWMPLLSNNDLLVSSSGLQSNLTILNVSQSDYGRYKVTATNDIGSYVQYFFLEREDIQKETYTTESCEVESNKTGTIVGICFGALSAGLAVYAIYLTVLHKRRSTRKGKQTTEDLNTQVTYINTAEEGTVRHINDSSGNKDDSAKLYTELAQYSKDEKSTYDVIQKN